MSPAEKQAREEQAERKMQKATDKAYMGSLTTTEPAPAPQPKAAPKKMAKGGSASARADGCCTKGKTKGRMI